MNEELKSLKQPELKFQLNIALTALETSGILAVPLKGLISHNVCLASVEGAIALSST